MRHCFSHGQHGRDGALLTAKPAEAKGGIAVDPRALSWRDQETLSRRYMQEMIPFVGLYTGVMAPDLGMDEQVMAWFVDTYPCTGAGPLPRS